MGRYNPVKDLHVWRFQEVSLEASLARLGLRLYYIYSPILRAKLWRLDNLQNIYVKQKMWIWITSAPYLCICISICIYMYMAGWVMLGTKGLCVVCFETRRLSTYIITSFFRQIILLARLRFFLYYRHIALCRSTFVPGIEKRAAMQYIQAGWLVAASPPNFFSENEKRKRFIIARPTPSTTLHWLADPFRRTPID